MKKEKIELEILSLQYERQISKAHTIFSCFWDIFFGTMVGFLGLVLSLYEIRVIDFNSFYFILILLAIFIVIWMAGMVAVSSWYTSRIERGNIINEINKLATS